MLVPIKELHRCSEGAVLCEPFFFFFFFCVVSGSPDMSACRAGSESVRKTAFLGFSSHKMMASVAFRSVRTSAL